MVIDTCRRVVLLSLVSLLGLLFAAAPGLTLQVGDKAPDFALPATTAEKINLADFQGKKPVVLFFYIGAFTGL
jgi:hypothetical protein